ncbi:MULTISPECIES: hypothetical protein [Paraburkholderia]|uniref:Uncharacterized protein n=1 Tax=Paraburkholderia madseniana TaxID=2599607 RepID=A0AAP5ESZ3_9BURK|nr:MULTISPECIES: hypothetical protein [Paraburkholderia]MCX4151685.1 hypothetical protein [Paraburkholderia madseniana]MCX4176960.1 hypothetical protein [Paraburkholderia madseniana]MDN7154613.1 hypothetical protein [Paraburkholderia sp. WS6]MDQ6413496.1 hypothetical protein [Paraburkholderia madseniana]MDQ6464950.1 hypothetical protein [Paraburkholderia madseniana]
MTKVKWTFAEIVKELSWGQTIGAKMNRALSMLGAYPGNDNLWILEPVEYQIAACLAIQQVGE